MISDRDFFRSFGFELEIDPVQPDFLIEAGAHFLGLEMEVLKCGHCPGSLCFLSRKDELLIGGDVLFAGGVGRWDLPQGDGELLSVGSRRLFPLGDNITVLPGHGPPTTIGTSNAEPIPLCASCRRDLNARVSSQAAAAEGPRTADRLPETREGTYLVVERIPFMTARDFVVVLAGCAARDDKRAHSDQLRFRGRGSGTVLWRRSRFRHSPRERKDDDVLDHVDEKGPGETSSRSCCAPKSIRQTRPLRPRLGRRVDHNNPSPNKTAVSNGLSGRNDVAKMREKTLRNWNSSLAALSATSRIHGRKRTMRPLTVKSGCTVMQKRRQRHPKTTSNAGPKTVHGIGFPNPRKGLVGPAPLDFLDTRTNRDACFHSDKVNPSNEADRVISVR